MSKPLSPALVRLIAVLIFIAGFSGAYLLFSQFGDKYSENKNKEPVSTTTEDVVPPPAPAIERREILKNQTPPENNSNTKNNEPRVTIPEISEKAKPVKITIEINGTPHAISHDENTSLYTAMAELEAQGKLAWVTKEFGSLGKFVDSINGVKSDRLTGKYWFFYVNGEASQVGISNYILKNNDSITWKYETSK